MSSVGRIAKPGFDWRSFDSYLFDIDGTLLNSFGGIHYHSFHKAMKAVWNCDQKIDGVPLHGNTDLGILRAALAQGGIGDEEFERKKDDALTLMRAEVESKSSDVTAEVCPSIPRVLGELMTAGKLLGVASGNLESIGWIKLKAGAIDHFFRFGSFSDRNEMRVEIFRHGAETARRLSNNPTAKICFVGDTPNDIDAAHKLELPVIAVATGIHKFEQLAALEPELCLRCCDELWNE